MYLSVFILFIFFKEYYVDYQQDNCKECFEVYYREYFKGGIYQKDGFKKYQDKGDDFGCVVFVNYGIQVFFSFFYDVFEFFVEVRVFFFQSFFWVLLEQ